MRSPESFRKMKKLIITAKVLYILKARNAEVQPWDFFDTLMTPFVKQDLIYSRSTLLC